MARPVVAPEEVLYTDKDYSGDTLDLDPGSLCPNPFNRREMKGVPELAATIKEVGLLQNIAHIRAEVWIAAYPETADRITAPHVILFGEHRWRAVRLLGWKTIPSVLQDDKVESARLIALVENLRRSQLSPLEEAEHYQELRATGLSYEQIAEKVGETVDGALSKGTVWKRVQLLSLAPEVQDALRTGRLKVSAAQNLNGMEDHDQRAYVALVQDGMRPAEARTQILARHVSAGNAGPSKTAEPDTAPYPRDQDETDRRAAAAARDTACQLLLRTVDPMSDDSSELLLRVLTSAVLAPPQQSAAQQRALVWLRRIDRNGPDETSAGAYFTAVQNSGDAGRQRLAAFASGLAAAELRTAARRQSWGSREIGYLRVLQEYAQYIPETEWEQKELGLVTAGEGR
ncbi:ParB/RepB/Spo0J family partition protein [Streptomyces sp. NBC_01465]|uniref:ParB/RepB/Spo0J family partition protein n=1 Tax=Streptomyces sp. NBC_01465 TaxID=2903878 RepID=UPI002E32A509|nr:ParB/RepB/Spo0J family partition protein [Streptomyces sp. NBC_01465]